MKANGAPPPRKAWPTVLLTGIISVVFVLALSGIHVQTEAIQQNESLEAFSAHLSKRTAALMALYEIPGVSIALAADGKLVFSSAFGYAQKETGRKLTTGTPMRVQSISKPVTAYGILKLQEQGKINLDAPVTQYLKSWTFPASKYPTEGITVRQLLSHTAGLPLGDVFTLYDPNDDMPTLHGKLTKEATAVIEPGTAFSYSNTGYHLLELLIQDVTGRDFSQFMEEEVLLPLGMTHSSFAWREELRPLVPTGYGLGGKPVPVYVYPEKSSGGLFATAEDILSFVTAGMPGFTRDGTVLSGTSIHTLYTPASNKLGIYSLVFEGYGLGYYLETLPRGRKAVSHGGQGTGIMTHFHAVPETGDAIVILTNSQRSWPFIASLLGDWARWRGFSPIGMERLLLAQYSLWAVIGIIWWAMLLKVVLRVTGMGHTKRKGTLHAKCTLLRRFAQGGTAILLLAVLGWCLSQKYLFLTSVFPRVSLWLGITAFALAILLMLFAVIPHQKTQSAAGAKTAGKA